MGAGKTAVGKQLAKLLNLEFYDTDEEIKKICTELVNSLGANSIKDMGKVMGELKKNYSDNLDFAKAGTLLKELLNK